ncbi:P-loop ATPase, Sll1717 family [Bradyrhizobium brasilense]|uniref:P-loop ATPase, Sll1717 family n=1 Tax=Bradyrhizobium brasilense TaxID=1419277 RepID=UPI003B968C00
MVAGRKGSGKTAIFFMVRDHFRRERHSIVADLRPESHRLSLFRSELLKMLETGTFDHTLAAFWYFVVLSEVLLTIRRDFQFAQRRSSVSVQSEIDELDRTMRNLQITDTGDFTARLNRLSEYVLREIKALSKKGQQLPPEQLTNVVFKGGIAEAKSLVSKLSAKSPNIVFLFDNIDKGWATNGVDEFDVRLVRLLIESLEKARARPGCRGTLIHSRRISPERRV